MMMRHALSDWNAFRLVFRGRRSSIVNPQSSILNLALLAALLLSVSSCYSAAFLREAVPNEAGFEGAVTVAAASVSKGVGCVTVDIPYRDVHGSLKMGQGRLFVRRCELKPGKPIPVFCHVHYEKGAGGARYWCDRGWAVATAHYKDASGGYPIDVSAGDGYNLARAVIEWVRRLPFIDRTHLHIDGGSQGGYMALAMSADFFPVTATTADCPVVNWAYNFAYFEANKAAARYPQTDIANSPLPILCSVTGLSDMTRAVFGNDLASDTWYYLSPIAYLDWIANPVLVLCATGDMLVPMEQMTRKYLRPYDRSRFPDNYQRDFDALTVCEPARKTFEELLDPATVRIEVLPLQENSFELTLAMFKGDEKKPRKRPKTQERPWSDKHQWSLCYLDEGGPSPCGSHTSYEWDTSGNSFVEAHRNGAPAPDILNAAKLDRLIQRYTGDVERVPKLADGSPANRLNFAPLEQLDVLTGLLDYAGIGEAHRQRLQSLYQAGTRRPLGDTLDLETMRKTRADLLAHLEGAKGGGS